MEGAVEQMPILSDLRDNLVYVTAQNIKRATSGCARTTKTEKTTKRFCTLFLGESSAMNDARSRIIPNSFLNKSHDSLRVGICKIHSRDVRKLSFSGRPTLRLRKQKKVKATKAYIVTPKIFKRRNTSKPVDLSAVHARRYSRGADRIRSITR